LVSFSSIMLFDYVDMTICFFLSFPTSPAANGRYARLSAC
jgi:hypothetical protein